MTIEKGEKWVETHYQRVRAAIGHSPEDMSNHQSDHLGFVFNWFDLLSVASKIHFCFFLLFFLFPSVDLLIAYHYSFFLWTFPISLEFRNDWVKTTRLKSGLQLVCVHINDTSSTQWFLRIVSYRKQDCHLIVCYFLKKTRCYSAFTYFQFCWDQSWKISASDF